MSKRKFDSDHEMENKDIFGPTSKQPSARLITAIEALKSKGYVFSPKTKKLCQIDEKTGKEMEGQGFVFEAKKGDQGFNQQNYEVIIDTALAACSATLRVFTEKNIKLD
jgi:hypothetical protein